MISTANVLHIWLTPWQLENFAQVHVRIAGSHIFCSQAWPHTRRCSNLKITRISKWFGILKIPSPGSRWPSDIFRNSYKYGDDAVALAAQISLSHVCYQTFIFFFLSVFRRRKETARMTFFECSITVIPPPVLAMFLMYLTWNITLFILRFTLLRYISLFVS